MFDNFLRKILKTFYNILGKTALGKRIEEEFEMLAYSGTSSRHYEYPFALSELVKANKKRKIKKVLDAGSYGSLLPLLMASLGFQVLGVDINDWEAEYPNFKTLKADLKKLPLRSNSFDCITAISTIEHCGLSRFREQEDSEGDIKAMEELKRVLKRGGQFLLTVPFAKKGFVYENKHRVYDNKRIKILLKGLKVKKKVFYGPVDKKGNFAPFSEKKASTFFSTSREHAVICVIAEK